MTEASDTRVAVYIDFDNIVISRYNQLHGKGQFQEDRKKGTPADRGTTEAQRKERRAKATVDIDAILDFATSFGTVAVSRAYADWSVPINASYQGQLIDRSVDLTQLFPTAAYTKNGADIRLAVDAVEDMFRLPELTHVIIVAGDSDYIALAQRCKRLGRYVVGIGVAGATSRSLAAACSEFADYDALPGIETAAPEPAETNRAAPEVAVEIPALTPQESATSLLARALRLGHAKDDADWLHSAEVKNQIKRMDPTFNEKELGYKTFSEFVKSRGKLAELDDSRQIRMIRLREAPQQ